MESRLESYKLDKIREAQRSLADELRMVHALIVVLTTIGVLVAALTLTTLLLVGRAFSDASPADMSTLYEEWQACMASEDRASECILEYDGDDSSNTPADWHWYWRTHSTGYRVLSPEQTVLLWDEAQDRD